MDYETRATSRGELRLYAKLFRTICGFTADEPIDPIALLDRLPELEGFEDVRYEIVYNNALPGNVPGSKAVYHKIVSAEGKTIEVYKDTFDPHGKLVHRKDK